jgi:glycosyltransferase involved in cell wall biosynthesis
MLAPRPKHGDLLTTRNTICFGLAVTSLPFNPLLKGQNHQDLTRMPTLEIAVFSYNRGIYLKNCIDSISRHLSSIPYFVYDDNSTDPDTASYLKTIATQVIQTEKDVSDRHGGYYQNMQSALDNAKSDYALLIQDDMQVVRPFLDSDLGDIDTIFQKNPSLAFLSPVFLKGRKRDFFRENYIADPQTNSYAWASTSDSLVPGCYADVSIVHVQRLRSASWTFQSSEVSNGELAKEKFGPMHQLSNPFIFYLPEEPAYRGKVLTLGAQIAFKMDGGKIKNFKDMSPRAVTDFINRDLAILPFAEDFIDTVDPRVKRPYKFNGYRKSYLTLLINKLELLIRKIVN